jgi:hypothetical protein
MNKRKQSPALFELLDSGKKSPSSDQLALPKWWKSDQQSAQLPPQEAESASKSAAETSPQEVERQQGTAPRAATSPEPVRPMTASPPPAAGPNPPMASLENGRLNLSLTPVTTAVITGVLLLALVASYQVGAIGKSQKNPVAKQDSAADVSEAMGLDSGNELLDVPEQRETPRNVSSAARNSSGQNAQMASAGAGTRDLASTWKKGWYYVWMETFDAEHLSNAKRAQRWYSQHGVDAWREQTSSGKWRLITRKGFPTRKKAESYGQYITSLAKKYKDDYGADAIYLFKGPLVVQNKK